MSFSLHRHTRTQEEIFASYNWWDHDCLLWRITSERCDYIESCIERVSGRGALRQQQLLEVGCGGGLISEELARRGAMVVGLDPSQQALAAAREHARVSGLGHNLYFEPGYGESLPYADGSFSAIVSLDTLEHVRDLEATIREIARVLAPGGIFVFDTINRTLLARMALIWIGERLFQKNGLAPGLHQYAAFIKPLELQAVITHYHLHVCELSGFMPRIVKGRLTLGPGWFKGVSYVGYATKEAG